MDRKPSGVREDARMGRADPASLSNEELLRRLQEVQRERDELRDLLSGSEKTVHLLREVAVIANEARSVRAALRRTLRRVCETLDWPIGHAFVKEGASDSLISARTWHVRPGLRIRRFREITEQTCCQPGRGLVGKVAATGSARWTRKVLAPGHRARTEHLKGLGIRSIYACPVLVEDEVVAVLEYFSCEERPPDSAFLDGTLGTQLARIFERRNWARQIEARAADEQRRIAQDLHDTIGQQLSGISMLVKSVEKQVERAQLPDEAVVKQALDALGQARRDVRRLAGGLFPLVIVPGGLPDALDGLAESLSALSGVSVTSECSEGADQHSPFVATTLYQVAQEMVENAIRHSGTDRIHINLRREPRSQSLCLSVRDYGIGLKKKPDGTGFRIMQYRASLIDASVEVESEPGKGTNVTCRVPVGA